MTTREMLTSLWDLRSPAWLVVAAGIVAYVALCARQASRSRRACFMGAVVVFLLALVSPIAVLARAYLFTAHMMQHLLLLLIMPMLILNSIPQPTHPRRPSAVLAILGWICGIGAMWFWHIPALCDASLRSNWIFAAQNSSLILAGLVFWRPIFAPNHAARLSPANATIYLFTACAGCTLLGVYVTFSPFSACPIYHHPNDALGLLPIIRDRWGLSFAADQQLGGLLRWVPACMIYLSVIMAMLARWYRAESSTASHDHVTA
jgi:cytochrome c oxidase assembly factor CtaG